jgi:hypothetical protein
MGMDRFIAGTLALAAVLLVLGGCSSVYFKHPDTGAVAECEPSRWFGPTTWWSVFPGQMYIHQYLCEKKWKEQGYVEVEKCKDVPPGTLCVSKDERREGSDTSVADQLRELKALHDQRLITDEEYEAKRRQILDRM